jgi:hypothetical protein
VGVGVRETLVIFHVVWKTFCFINAVFYLHCLSRTGLHGGLQICFCTGSRNILDGHRKRRVETGIGYKKIKQSRYRPRVAQRVQGS